MYELNLYVIIGLVVAMLISGLASMAVWYTMIAQVKDSGGAFQTPILRPSLAEMRQLLRLHHHYFPSSRLRMIWIALASMPIVSMLVLIGSELLTR
jgi:hypothetical protein